MTDYSDLKLLAEAATAGPWVSSGNWVSTSKGNSVADCPRGDESFIAAANPTAVLTLIAENDRVNAELSACKEGPGTCGYWRDAARSHLGEINKLKELINNQKGSDLACPLHQREKCLACAWPPMDKSQLAALKTENEALRKIISDSASSCGASVSVECSLDFMAHLPVEIFLVISKLRNALADCSDSLHGEMLQKFGGQLPGDMHPVTRRDYNRDMEEVAGYRAALINAAMSKKS